MAPVQKVQRCGKCHGWGTITPKSKKKCPACKGDGEIVISINGAPIKKQTKKK